MQTGQPIVARRENGEDQGGGWVTAHEPADAGAAAAKLNKIKCDDVQEMRDKGYLQGEGATTRAPMASNTVYGMPSEMLDSAAIISSASRA